MHISLELFKNYNNAVKKTFPYYLEKPDETSFESAQEQTDPTIKII